MHGQFVWYELTTPDVEGATKFYPRFTNWGTQRFDDDYTMWTSGGVPFAGIFRMKDGMVPNWMPYIESNNVDDTVAKAKSLGADVIVGPDDIPGTGRFAVVQDPQGAIFGVYKSFNQSAGWDGTPVVGKPSWHELMTHDHEQAAMFYNALFGWDKISEMDMGGGSMYYMFGHPGNENMYGGMFSMNDDFKGMHPFWLVYFHVPDVGKAVDIATKHGANVHRPQMDIPGGSIAILGDPQGAGFAVHHVNPPVVEKVTAAVKAVARKAADRVRAVVKKAAKLKKKAKKAAPKRTARTAAKSKARTTARTKAKAKPRTRVKASSRPKVKAKKKAPAKKKATTRRPARKK